MSSRHVEPKRCYGRPLASLPQVEAGWVVIAVASFVGGSVLGWLGGWWRLRRAEQGRQSERDAERAAHERRVAGLRTELVAAAAARSLAGRASAARASAPAAAGAGGRTVADIEAELLAAEVELQALREQQAILAPLVDEVEVTRRYVETLQRELVYRDEQLIELHTGPRVGRTLAPGPAAGPDTSTETASAGELGSDRIEQPAVEELLERDPGNL